MRHYPPNGFFMKKFIFAIMPIFASPAFCEEDATFNGILSSASCHYTVETHCDEEHYCYTHKIRPAGIFEAAYDIKNSRIHDPEPSKYIPFEIKSVSAAKINQPLSVKLEYKLKNGTLAKTTILLLPNTDGSNRGYTANGFVGSYTATSGVTFGDKLTYYGDCSLNTVLSD